MIRNKISHYGAKNGDLEFALSRMLHVHALSNLCVRLGMRRACIYEDVVFVKYIVS